MRKFKFRGFDNPSIVGTAVYYGEGRFTVGKAYLTDVVDEYKDDGSGGFAAPDAAFADDVGKEQWEELVFFDEVLDEET